MAIRIKDTAKWIKENPGVPIGLAALGVSTANYRTNRARHIKDREYQERQLQAMNKLTDSINRMDKTVGSYNENMKNIPQFAQQINNNQSRRKSGILSMFRIK